MHALGLAHGMQPGGMICAEKASKAQWHGFEGVYGLSRPPSDERFTFIAHWGITNPAFNATRRRRCSALVFVPLIQPTSSDTRGLTFRRSSS